MPRDCACHTLTGDIAVRLDRAREVDEDISHRALTVSRGGQARRVDHFQYHAWPDHGVPRTTRPLRALARLLVHSSGSQEGFCTEHRLLVGVASRPQHSCRDPVEDLPEGRTRSSLSHAQYHADLHQSMSFATVVPSLGCGRTLCISDVLKLSTYLHSTLPLRKVA